MVKTCEHIKIDGNPCGSPALRERNYCYFHDSFHNLNNLPGSPDYEIPALEDPLSIQLFIMQIAHAQACGSINREMSAQLLAISRTATANLRLITRTAKS